DEIRRPGWPAGAICWTHSGSPVRRGILDPCRTNRLAGHWLPMPDESTGRGAPRPWQHEVTSRLAPEANTANFPTVFGANVTMTTVSDPLVGRLLDGRYQITQRLARGGGGDAYPCAGTRLTRP